MGKEQPHPCTALEELSRDMGSASIFLLGSAPQLSRKGLLGPSSFSSLALFLSYPYVTSLPVPFPSFYISQLAYTSLPPLSGFAFLCLSSLNSTLHALKKTLFCTISLFGCYLKGRDASLSMGQQKHLLSPHHTEPPPNTSVV